MFTFELRYAVKLLEAEIFLFITSEKKYVSYSLGTSVTVCLQHNLSCLLFQAHCRAFMVQTFADTLNSAKATMSPAVHQVLTNLCELYAVYWILKELGPFLMVTLINEQSSTVILKKLLTKLFIPSHWLSQTTMFKLVIIILIKTHYYF